MKTSDDGLVLIMVTTGLALPRGAELKPLTISEWGSLAAQLHTRGLRPAAMLGQTAEELRRDFDLEPALSERIAFLGSRGAQVALELERLGSLGIWSLTRADSDYPERLKQRLGSKSPPVFFGAGSTDHFHNEGIAVVGSRDVDEAALLYAAGIGRLSVASGITVISGGARGIDKCATNSAILNGGSAISVISDQLESAVRSKESLRGILDKQLTLMTPYLPKSGFSVGNAMGRNKYIYCLASRAIVVSTSAEQGGTRAGALDNLRHSWTPMYVRVTKDSPEGNLWLQQQGAKPIGELTPEISLRDQLDTCGPLNSDNHDETTTKSNQSAQNSMNELDLSLSETDKIVPGRSAAVDFFAANWPRIATLLSTPKTEAEVLELVEELSAAQLKSWLKRAVDHGLASRAGRPPHYSVIALSGNGAKDVSGSDPTFGVPPIGSGTDNQLSFLE